MRNRTTEQILLRASVGLFAAGVVGGSLAACSNVEPLNYTAIHEIPDGPGLFSGVDGEFDLYGDD